ncbi:MAG: autotransporter domain-containing protein, partial [Gammaproteobacteria bacterium]
QAEVVLSIGSHTIDLLVTDDAGLTSRIAFSVTVEEGADVTPPVANPGSDLNVKDDDSDGFALVQLDGSASADDREIVSYEWFEGGELIATGVQTEAVLAVGTHTIELRVTDSAGLSGTTAFAVTIEGNELPIADAGDDQTIQDEDGDGFAVADLDGSRSTDDGQIVSYRWTEDGQEIATGEVTEVSLAVGTHEIVLTVTDDDQNTSEDTVVIRIDPSEQRDLSELPGLNPTQRTLARAIDSFCPRLAERANDPNVTLSPDQQELLTRCLAVRSQALSDAQAVEAVKALGVEEYTAVQTTAIDFSQSQLANIESRLLALRRGNGGSVSIAGLTVYHEGRLIPVAQLGAFAQELMNGGVSGDEDEGIYDDQNTLLDNRLGIFFNGSIRSGDTGETDNEPALDFDSWGVTAGVDYRATDRFAIGLSLGYNDSDSDFRLQGGGLKGESITGSVYGTYYTDRLYFDFIGSLSSVDYLSTRRIVYTDTMGSQDFTAFGDTGGDIASIGASFGYDFRHDFSKGSLSFGPTVSFNSIDVDVDGFTETGAGGLNMMIGKQKAKSRTVLGGVRGSYAFSRSWGILQPHARLSFVRELEDNSSAFIASFAADPFVNDPNRPTPGIIIRTDPPDKDYVRWGVGVSALFVNGISAFIDYESYAGYKNLSSDELSFGLRFERRTR